MGSNPGHEDDSRVILRDAMVASVLCQLSVDLDHQALERVASLILLLRVVFVQVGWQAVRQIETRMAATCLAHANCTPFLDFVTEKNSFFCHLENTVFQTLRKNAFFISFAHFSTVFRGVKEPFFSPKSESLPVIFPEKKFCWLI